jgi:hypothetical protein
VRVCLLAAVAEGALAGPYGVVAAADAQTGRHPQGLTWPPLRAVCAPQGGVGRAAGAAEAAGGAGDSGRARARTRGE